MSDPLLKLLDTKVEEGSILVLTIRGSQVQHEETAQALLNELIAATDHFRPKHVILDLQSIKYISSVALRPFLALKRRIEEGGGMVVLCNLSNLVGDVFYTTRMVDPSGSFAAPFQMEKDPESALAWLRATRAG